MIQRTPKTELSENALAPGIIIGAGRSGTNMLRDMLVSLPQFTTWPCDEINYIWRHGNRSHETDEFSREMASSRVKHFVRKKFAQVTKSCPRATVIEKTCANSLRCGFVHEIFPNAKFVHIIRDGRDVAASAALRWNAKLDVNYILKKARFVPPIDLPWYASAYLKARIFRLFSGSERLSTWGPQYDGMQEVMRDNKLPVACAIQWQRCVESAIGQLERVPSDQVLTIHYETFVSNPRPEFLRVCDFFDTTIKPEKIGKLIQSVSAKSVGKWKSQLTDDEATEIQSICGSLLSRLGYGTHKSNKRVVS